MLVDKRTTIICHYLRTWFLIDLLSIIPFQYMIVESGSYGRLLRLTRVSKLFRMIKLLRLFKMTKFMKDNKLLKFMNKLMKNGSSVERLFNFALLALLLVHFSTCLWVLIPEIEDTSPNWMFNQRFNDFGAGDKYIASFYFVITCITTVGFGDVTPQTTGERVFVLCLMVCGAISFTFAAGAISSILSQLDSVDQKFKEKINNLDDLRRQYNIGPMLYDDIKQAIKFELE
jgi:hypothetical protein